MDSMGSLNRVHGDIVRTLCGVHVESMRTAFLLLPLLQESMWTLCGVYAESMKTPYGVHMDFAKFMDSMETCD